MLSKPPTSFSSTTLIVSSSEDDKSHAKLQKLGYTIHSNELILTGVLRQKLQLDQPEHILSPATDSHTAAASKPTKAKKK
jgi:hypothetical protein